MSLHEFRKALNGRGVEGELLKTVFLSLLVSGLTFALLYFLKLRYVDDFIPDYGFWIFFSILSYAIVLPSVRQVRSFKQFPCMTGMMIGMTIGMMIGFLIGFYVGATNGMFWGGFYGTAIGIFLGVWNGKCCGVMGVMEGMMAGFMGGLMGAMSAVMMFNDNLRAAGVLVFLICGAILFGLNYMLFTETRSVERERVEGQLVTMILSFILTVITVWMVVFGPRSVLFQ